MFEHLTARRRPSHRPLKRYPLLAALFGLILLLSALPAQSLVAGASAQDALAPHKLREKLYPPPTTPAPPPAHLTQGTVETFPVLADTDLQEAFPNQNFGIEGSFGSGYSNEADFFYKRRRALLDFGISTFLPPGTIIHQAELQVYVSGYCDYMPTSFYKIFGVTQHWNELTATWNKQPAIASAEVDGNSIPTATLWVGFDITKLVQAWVTTPSSEFGLEIRGPETPPNPCALREFRSKGGGGFSTAPQVMVDYTLPTPALTVSSSNIIFTQECGAGAGAPAPQTLLFESNSTTLSTWSASVSGAATWLHLSKTSGKVSHIFPEQITLTASKVPPCPSTRTAKIQITAGGGSTRTIDVTFKQGAQAPGTKIYLPLVLNTRQGASPRIEATAAGSAQRVALLIGVADYKYLPVPQTFSIARPGLWGKKLLAPRSDVIALSAEMYDPNNTGISGAVSALANPAIASNPVILLPERLATKENIDYALQWIDEREDASTEVLIYFSGHGGPTPDVAPLDEADHYDEMLGAYDTNDTPQDGFVNHILDDNFKTQLANLETQHLALIVDACNSGGLDVGNPKRAVLAAAREDQVSWETSDLEHGVFTYFMLKAMHDPTADTNGDGWISVNEIYNYARPRVTSYAKTNLPQQQDLTLNLTSDVNVVRLAP